MFDVGTTISAFLMRHCVYNVLYAFDRYSVVEIARDFIC
jgi:hypothetical protein